MSHGKAARPRSVLEQLDVTGIGGHKDAAAWRALAQEHLQLGNHEAADFCTTMADLLSPPPPR